MSFRLFIRPRLYVHSWNCLFYWVAGWHSTHVIWEFQTHSEVHSESTAKIKWKKKLEDNEVFHLPILILLTGYPKISSHLSSSLHCLRINRQNFPHMWFWSGIMTGRGEVRKPHETWAILTAFHYETKGSKKKIRRGKTKGFLANLFEMQGRSEGLHCTCTVVRSLGSSISSQNLESLFKVLWVNQDGIGEFCLLVLQL